MTIKRIEPLPLAKITAVIYALVGLLVGAVGAFMAVVAATRSGEMNNSSALFGVRAIVVMPSSTACWVS